MPPFVNIDHDAEARTAKLSVQNAEVKRQKEMWGMHPPHRPNFPSSLKSVADADA